MARRRPVTQSNQPVSRSAPQTSSSSNSNHQPVSLTMTTIPVDKREARQLSAGSSLSHTSRVAEEEKVEQLKNMTTLVKNMTS